MEQSQEVNGPPIEACAEAPEVLELVEATFDAVAGLIEPFVERKPMRSPGVGRDHSLSAHGADVLSESVAVISGVSDDRFGFASFEQHGRYHDVVNLTRGKQKAQRSTEPFGEHVNLGCQSSSGTPQSLVARPPFPVAACW